MKYFRKLFVIENSLKFNATNATVIERFTFIEIVHQLCASNQYFVQRANSKNASIKYSLD